MNHGIFMTIPFLTHLSVRPRLSFFSVCVMADAVVEEENQHHQRAKRTRSSGADPHRDWPLRSRKKQRRPDSEDGDSEDGAEVQSDDDAKSSDVQSKSSDVENALKNDAAIAATLAEIFEQEDLRRHHHGHHGRSARYIT